MTDIATIPYPKVTDIKKRAFLQALTGSLGIVSQALKQSGNIIHRDTHYEWLKHDPDYAEAVASVGEHVLDFAESALHKNIALGKEQSLVFFLKTRGKARGYSVREEGEEGGRAVTAPIINIIMPQQNS